MGLKFLMLFSETPQMVRNLNTSYKENTKTSRNLPSSFLSKLDHQCNNEVKTAYNVSMLDSHDHKKKPPALSPEANVPNNIFIVN